MNSEKDVAVAAPLKQDLFDLRVCVSCAGALVYPTLWRPTYTQGVWFIALRCPDCEHARHGFSDEAEFDRLDDAMNAGFEQMHCALDNISGERMRADCERIIGAINAGAILPEDFSPTHH